MTDERLYLLSDVAEMTGLSERGLADAARANKMPHHRIHGRRYMTQSQIRAYIEGTLVGPARDLSVQDLIAMEGPRRQRSSPKIDSRR